MIHIPVMLDEVIDLLNIQKDKIYIDATFGRGGYSNAILKSGGKVIAIDRDIKAVEYAKNHFKNDKFQIYHDIFSNLENIILDIPEAIIFDLGICTDQLQYTGISFHSDHLDMDMGLSRYKTYDLINKSPLQLLHKIISEYGEEKYAYKIAKLIIQNRPIKSSKDLAQIIADHIPRSKIHAATKTFQAIRIYINDELNEIYKALRISMNMKIPKIIAVTFHSLEDRIVKRAFIKQRSYSSAKLGESIAKESEENIYNHKLYFPSNEEIKNNRSARSAKLRIGYIKNAN